MNINKNISVWRGDTIPPTKYHLWIKSDGTLYTFNGYLWEALLNQIPLARIDTDGLMSKEDKKTLDNLSIDYPKYKETTDDKLESLENKDLEITDKLNLEINRAIEAELTIISDLSSEITDTVDSAIDSLDSDQLDAGNHISVRVVELNGKLTSVTIAETDIASLTALNNHIIDKQNPHSVTKALVGLSNVNNTSDVNKPVSTALAAAIKVVQDNLTSHKEDKANPHEVTKALVGLGNVTNDTQVKRSEMGTSNGVATLDSTGKILSSLLPSFVDDIVDVYATYLKSAVGSLSNIVLYHDSAKTKTVAGESGKIYLNITAGEPAYQFRWTGTVFAQTGATSLIVGEVAGTAYDGAKGKATTDKVNEHVANTSNPHNVTKQLIGLGNVDNTADINKPVSTAQATAIADAKKAGTDAQAAVEAEAEARDNAIKALDTIITSTDGTNVLVKVSEVDGLVTAVNIVKDDTAKSSDLTAEINRAKAAEKAAKTVVNNKTTGHVRVSSTTDPTNGNDIITITENDIASASALISHVNDQSNPHNVTKTQVGLGNVDNTSDTNKPISTATLTALDTKVDKTTTVNGHALSTNITVTKADVSLGNVDNESKATMFNNPNFTGVPTAPTAASTTDTTLIATTAFVQSAIGTKLAANDAMLFKGTIGTGGTVTTLPDTHQTGWTYKVITAGTYAGFNCEVGDLIICVTDGTTANNAHWTVVLTNIDGAVTGPVTTVNNAIALFNGTTGKIIKKAETVGSSSQPIYLYNGIPTAIAYKFGNFSGAAAVNNGTLNLNLNADMLDGAHIGNSTGDVVKYTEFPSYLELVAGGYMEEDPGRSSELFLKGFCRWLGANHQGHKLIGSIIPNSEGFCLVHVYNSGVGSDGQGGTDGGADARLPRHCSGLYVNILSLIVAFATNNGVWRYGASIHGTANTALKIGSSTIGDISLPVYIYNGTPKIATQVPKVSVLTRALYINLSTKDSNTFYITE